MAETTKLESNLETKPIQPQPTAPARPKRGFAFYARGSWAFFKKMWPAIYDLTTTETYVNASAIAFNILLSLFSFVVLIGSFLLNVLHWQRGYEVSFKLLLSLAPEESGILFRSLDQVTRGPGGKATLVSFALMIFSASGVFQPIEAALNRAWGFKERNFVKQYAVYLALVVVCAVILLVPVALASVYDYVLDVLLGQSPWRAFIFNGIVRVLALPFIIALFFVIYYVTPHGKVNARQTFFTAVSTALLWLIVTVGFWLALPLFNFKESFSAMASLMALLTWVFISSFVLILGANLAAHKVLPETWTGFLPLRRQAQPMSV